MLSPFLFSHFIDTVWYRKKRMNVVRMTITVTGIKGQRFGIQLRSCLFFRYDSFRPISGFGSKAVEPSSNVTELLRVSVSCTTCEL
jgi:hypothetical protein